MKDILHLCLQMDVPHKYKKIVVQNIANLPPSSYLNSDSVKILKELESVKTEMQAVEQNQRHITRCCNSLKKGETY